MSEDYKIKSAYEGGECQVKYATPASMTLEVPKPKYNLVFMNAEGYEVGALDFHGPGLSFEGVADLSAITFMDHVSKVFQQRLKDEYDKGYADGKASQTTG
jgi:hypothetical protein